MHAICHKSVEGFPGQSTLCLPRDNGKSTHREDNEGPANAAPTTACVSVSSGHLCTALRSILSRAISMLHLKI
jgi:hypothetical protein